SPLEVTPATLSDATEGIQRLDNFARRLGPVQAAPAAEVLERFRAAMDDDFTTPTATAVVFDAVRDANAALDAGDRAAAESLGAAVFELSGALGLQLRGRDADAVDAESARLAAARDAARKARDWAQADALRDQLLGLGWKVEDGAQGTRLSR
ncbi:MAG: cysteine--tRNA ligase, partial [Actinobacteria bacterium]|nr:cysteine--tRNA ligase [Actinomycetota bacterium]